MRHRVLQVLSVLLAITTVGASFVCACPPQDQPAQLVASAASCDTPCCEGEPAAPEPGQPSAPCKQCNLEHRADQPPPAQHDAMGELQSLAVLPPVPFISLPERVATPSPRLHRGLPAPPLLLDLFHTSVLLLV
jgi:hypothetical protein